MILFSYICIYVCILSLVSFIVVCVYGLLPNMLLLLLRLISKNSHFMIRDVRVFRRPPNLRGCHIAV